MSLPGIGTLKDSSPHLIRFILKLTGKRNCKPSPRCLSNWESIPKVCRNHRLTKKPYRKFCLRHPITEWKYSLILAGSCTRKTNDREWWKPFHSRGAKSLCTSVESGDGIR